MRDGWGQAQQDPTSTLKCTIHFEECFGYSNSHSNSHGGPGLLEQGPGVTRRASEVFASVAFSKPTQCGDCIVKALVASSGKTGLSAFLPDRSRIVPSSSSLPSPSSSSASASGHQIPHLPLVSDWRTGDFSLTGVLGASSHGGGSGTNVRNWTMQMLQRYRFVIGSTPSIFASVTNPSSARGVVRTIKDDREVALLCVNDDVISGEEEVDDIWAEWQENQWNQPAAWERLE